MSSKAYYQIHKEEILKRQKEYLSRPEVRKRVRERGRINARAWRSRPEVKERLKLQRRARQRKEGNRPPRESSTQIYREAIIRHLVERDGINCGFCGQPVDLKTVTIDHKTPKFYGGEHVLSNFRLAHHLCNSEAGGRLRRQYP